ncbi:hypothetical protein OU994_24675 [Pseudoduganella sp. SL102]|uniref:hypothetical protein n=1 Tax=Pseudoduganella sp. SL102 TaxID=2995154 RepID=UPI00248C6964|nr:hypothetical protein [Pseudoduganella sp. SL102]WBS01439.1 hypothetical protein OU994_24675 [Pseudoduganella sp. SL102]
MRVPAAVLAAALALPCAAENVVSGQARAQAETWHSPSPERDGTQPRQAIDMRWQVAAPVGAQLHGSAGLRHDAAGTGVRLFELALERPLAGGYATAGKKVMSWDVGYAFRPLDVVQQEDRRALYPGTLEGVPLLAWEAFDAERAVTVVWSNPGHGKAGQPRDDGALAVRLYRQRGARDEYAVLRASARNGIEAGASFSQVVNDGLELHGALLAQQRHDEWDGMRWQPRSGGGKALAGFTWTTEGRLSVLGEAWVDRTVPAAQRRNLLLRAAQKFGDVELVADGLWRRAGRVATLGASWKPDAWLLSATWRRYDGIGSVALLTAERGF